MHMTVTLIQNMGLGSVPFLGVLDRQADIWQTRQFIV